jgi:hypothetical protein
MGPVVGGILADTVGIRAPFTFTGAAALLAALYGLLRLPETRSRGVTGEGEASPEVGVVRNNAVPAILSGGAVKLRVPVEATVGAGGSGQSPSQVQADELRRYESSTVSREFSANSKPLVYLQAIVEGHFQILYSILLLNCFSRTAGRLKGATFSLRVPAMS